jgi:signal transduction histidine kinase
LLFKQNVMPRFGWRQSHEALGRLMRPELHTLVSGDFHGLDWPALERSTVVAAVIVSASGRIAGANALLGNLLRMGAAGDLVGRSLQDLMIDSSEWTPWARAIRGGRGSDLTVRLRRSDDVTVVLRGDVSVVQDGTGKPQLLGLLVDKSEELQLRHAMQRSARLEALGSLTSGIAHDFNNLLTVLVGNLSLVAEELRARPDQFAKLKSARDAAKRGADLIRQLLAFARHQPTEAKLIKPSQIVSNLVPLLTRALGAKVKLEAQLDPQSSAVRGNVAQFESAIVNLAVNARDALESNGVVTISVADRDLRAAEAEQYKLQQGQHVRITVSDNGSGIPADTLARVFEPFFSTKGDRGGTGLGLAMVRGYASQFGGAAHIDSSPGKGTSVTLLFPRSSDTLDETSAKTMPLSTLPSGTETVLLLASEEAVRSTVGQILEVLGYSVDMTLDAGEAREKLRNEKFDLVIIDGMHAEISADLASGAIPGLPYKLLRLTSGAEGAAPGIEQSARVLMKPFSLAELAKTVRTLLDS